jgi:hypothetical protein
MIKVKLNDQQSAKTNKPDLPKKEPNPSHNMKGNHHSKSKKKNKI